ncbi:unnamed protein product [Arctia plantaginis]|uniref:Uncharacterized protein n=1 Tax=Arctia plantaginis TaxID=874455 RepID=A0A8S0ZEL7_ARCPL|nr:unnamed protein product [Arctia plantaginis]CAB3249878.1 unnamed protein product [Arctia plantaginis]
MTHEKRGKPSNSAGAGKFSNTFMNEPPDPGGMVPPAGAFVTISNESGMDSDQLVEETFPQDTNTCDTDYFKSVLLQAADIVKRKPRNNKLSSPPWWDEECTSAISRRNLAEKNYRINMSLENYDALLEIMNEARKLFKKKKFEGWRNFCSSLSPETHSQRDPLLNAVFTLRSLF